MTDEGVRAAARSVRSFLLELVGPDSEALDEELAALLARSAGAEELRLALAGHEGTRVFLDAVLDDSPAFRPPQVRRGAFKGGYQPGPGRLGPLEAPKFRCPAGDDFDWWRLDHGRAVPICPTHQCPLVTGD